MPILKPKYHIYAGIISILILITGCSNNDESYFPLQPGKYWRYQMRYQTMDGKFKGVYAVENLQPISRNDELIYVRKLLDGSINYLKKTDEGIILTGWEKTTDLQTNNGELDKYILKFPLKEGNEWKEFRKTKALIKTGPPQKTEFHIVGNIPVVTKIESMAEVVKVPAGTFDNCMKVVTKGDAFINAGNYVGMTLIKVLEINWYSPGIGLVKSQRVETTASKALNRGEILLELESYR